MEINLDDLPGVLDLAINLGLGGVIVNVVKSEKNDSKWIEDNFDTINQSFHEAFEFARNHGIQLKLPDHLGTFVVDADISNRSSKYSCSNCLEEVYIRYNGDLTVCNMLNPYIYGNLNLISFEDMWNGLNAQMFRKLINTRFKHSYCKDCYYMF